MHIIFIATLLFMAGEQTPIAAYQFETEAQCMSQLEFVREDFKANFEEMSKLVLDAGAYDMMAGCYSIEEAAAILVDPEISDD